MKMTEQEFWNIKKKVEELAKTAHYALRDYKGGAVYEDTIIELCGYAALVAMRECHLIEGCGNIDGRKLYAI